jgi:hypothetical protein
MSLAVIWGQGHRFRNVAVAVVTLQGGKEGKCQNMTIDWLRCDDGRYYDANHLLRKGQSRKLIHGVPLTMVLRESVQGLKERKWVTGKSRQVDALLQAQQRLQDSSQMSLTFRSGKCPEGLQYSKVSVRIPTSGD